MSEGRDQARPASAGDRESGQTAVPTDSAQQEVAAKLVAALDRLARAQRKHRQESATRLGITPLQAEVLRTLIAGPPPAAAVGAVARELGVKQPTVTDSVSALERKGLVTRQRSEHDLRRTTLRLTEAGRKIGTALASADSEMVMAVSGLPSDEVTSTYVAVLGLIKRFVDTGYIDVARTCLTCRYMTQGTSAGKHCTLLDMALPDRALRVNCAEHEAV